MLKRIKVRTLVAAIRKNGHPKAKGEYGPKYNFNSEPGYCAFGQAGMNLGIRPATLHGEVEARFKELSDRIVYLNDKTGLAVPQIADLVEKEYADLMNKYITIY